jgi:hypothetical protein
MKKLAQRTAETIRGAVDRARRTSRPRPADIDWPRTIRANIDKYQAELGTIVPERLIGYRRHARSRVDLDSVILCVDQSGSMAACVVYSSIFAAVMASLPVIETQLVCSDTAILDLTDELADPVEVLFGVQLGGGTDINAALAYCETKITRPTNTHLILITDLYEGGNASAMLARAETLVASGVNLIVLLALSDSGRPGYDANHAGKLAALGCPVFACTPDIFPDLMAAALRRHRGLGGRARHRAGPRQRVRNRRHGSRRATLNLAKLAWLATRWRESVRSRERPCAANASVSRSPVGSSVTGSSAALRALTKPMTSAAA